MPFLAGCWFKILTVGSHFFLVHIWLPTSKINPYLVSLVMWKNVNEVLCWKHLPGVGIREITTTLSQQQLWAVEAIMGPTAEHQLVRPSHSPTNPSRKGPGSHPAPNPALCQAAAGTRQVAQGCHPAQERGVCTPGRHVPSTALTLPRK